MPSIIGQEYEHTHPEHYDGVSVWMCELGHRWGRWSQKVLKQGEVEGRFGRDPNKSP